METIEASSILNVPKFPALESVTNNFLSAITTKDELIFAPDAFSKLKMVEMKKVAFMKDIKAMSAAVKLPRFASLEIANNLCYSLHAESVAFPADAFPVLKTVGANFFYGIQSSTPVEMPAFSSLEEADARFFLGNRKPGAQFIFPPGAFPKHDALRKQFGGTQ